MHFAETVPRRTFGKTVFAADLKISKTTTEHFLLRKGLEEDEKDLDANWSLMLVLQLQVSLKNS